MTLHAALVAEATRTAPRECCGVLGGRGMRALSHFPVTNASPNPESSYSMPPVEQWTALKELRRQGHELVGFYHSHPRTAAVPSPTDIALSYYPDAVMVIIGLAPQTVVRAFRVAGGQGLEIPVVLSTGD
jgi:proteasome lid subunit RPN8/RPN11